MARTFSISMDANEFGKCTVLEHLIADCRTLRTSWKGFILGGIYSFVSTSETPIHCTLHTAHPLQVTIANNEYGIKMTTTTTTANVVLIAAAVLLTGLPSKIDAFAVSSPMLAEHRLASIHSSPFATGSPTTSSSYVLIYQKFRKWRTRRFARSVWDACALLRAGKLNVLAVVMPFRATFAFLLTVHSFSLVLERFFL